VNSIVTVRADNFLPRAWEHRGSAIFMLCKKMISNNSWGSPSSVGMAGVVSFLLDLDFVFRCRFELYADVEEICTGDDEVLALAAASAGCWSFRFLPRTMMGVNSIGLLSGSRQQAAAARQVCMQLA